MLDALNRCKFVQRFTFPTIWSNIRFGFKPRIMASLIKMYKCEKNLNSMSSLADFKMNNFFLILFPTQGDCDVWR